MATYRLSWSVRNARSNKIANSLRNYRRKRSQIKKLHAQLSDDFAETDTSSLEDETKYPDRVNEPYVLSPIQWIARPHWMKELVRQAIMNEFWTCTL